MNSLPDAPATWVFPLPELDGEDAKGSAITLATLVEITAAGELWVEAAMGRIRCHVVNAGGRPLEFNLGDTVLVWRPLAQLDWGVVLGRVGPYVPASADPARIPEHVEICASKSISITCGEGAVRIRNDGKVLIEASQMVASAKVNVRIKAGTVSIN